MIRFAVQPGGEGSRDSAETERAYILTGCSAELYGFSADNLSAALQHAGRTALTERTEGVLRSALELWHLLRQVAEQMDGEEGKTDYSV